MTAHPVGHEEEPEVLPYAVAVFVVLPAASRIGQGGAGQSHLEYRRRRAGVTARVSQAAHRRSIIRRESSLSSRPHADAPGYLEA